MKKIALLIFAFVFSANITFADGDLWDNFGDNNIYGQKAVSEQDFDKALESKQKKKKRDKNIPKGESFSQSNETNVINNSSKEPSIVLIPVPLKINDKYVIPIGHYRIEGEKKDGEIFFNLYQAHNLVAKIPAEETDDDFGEETINFVKLRPHGDCHVEIIFGGIDFNAYSIIDIE